jgi:hypothetical protein
MGKRLADTNTRGRADYLSILARLPFLLYRSIRYRTGHWLPGHLISHCPFDQRVIGKDTPIDVVVIFVDHFEPSRERSPAAAVEAVRSWCEEYETIAGRHRDADGRPPLHTWFYAADYPNLDCVRCLSDSVYLGFGEIEFHLHHGFDRHESFAAKLRAGLAWFNQYGAMLTAEAHPRQRFGYVAGNWALDNGQGDDSKSGCNTELLALRENGCYADFTFPALGKRAQPRKTNAIYYATDGPEPKSYDTGTDVEVGRPPSGDLMIVQGPLVVNWQKGRFEYAELETWTPPSPDRLGCWLKANVHVKGRPEWVFVKLHTHAIQSRSAFLSPELDATLAAMNARWNQPPFRLHFVTAREAYNIVKAAEAGRTGNPNDYRNYVIPPPANRKIRCTSPWRLLTYDRDTVGIRLLERGAKRIEFTEGPLRSVQGNIWQLDAVFRGGLVEAVRLEGEGEFELVGSDGTAGRPSCVRVHCDSLQRLTVAWPFGRDDSVASPARLDPQDEAIGLTS